jgi:hypothetical protein
MRAPGQPVEPPPEAANLARLHDGEQQQDEDRQAKADDDRAENGLDEGVQVDRSILRAGRMGSQAASAAARV